MGRICRPACFSVGLWTGGVAVGGTVAHMGVCKACLPSRVANLVLDGCGTQFGTGLIKICGLYLAVLENNCKSAHERAVFLQVTCLFLCLQAAWRPRGPRLVLDAGAFGQEKLGGDVGYAVVILCANFYILAPNFS